MSTLDDLLKFEGKEINHLFEKASVEGSGTPQEVSDRRENALTVFLKKYFPFPYRLAKGNIRDSFGQSSMSIDCILLNPNHPYTTNNDSQYSIILADGVDVAIELKPKLTSVIEIERALKQIKSVKELTRVKSGLINLGKKYSKEYEQTCKKIPSIIFSNETYSNYKILIEKIVNFYEKEKIKREHQFDMIVINEKIIILNCKKDSYHNPKELEHLGEGFYTFEYGLNTISAFLLLLNKYPQSEIRISSTVIEHYIKLETTNVKYFKELNERLSRI